MLKTKFKSICLSDHCPNQYYTVTATGINLTEASCLQTGETYLESTLREWLIRAPGQCGKHFIGTPPVSADAILGPQCLDVTSGQNYQPHVCDGVHKNGQRKFCNGLPIALPHPDTLFCFQWPSYRA